MRSGDVVEREQVKDVRVGIRHSHAWVRMTRQSGKRRVDDIAKMCRRPELMNHTLKVELVVSENFAHVFLRGDAMQGPCCAMLFVVESVKVHVLVDDNVDGRRVRGVMNHPELGRRVDVEDFEVTDAISGREQADRRIAERRVRLGLVLSEIGEKNNIQVTDEEMQRALYDRVRQFPGQEQQVFEFYKNNQQALASLRAPIYEEKVVDFMLELAKVTDKTVTKEELEKLVAEDEDAA